MVDCAAIVSESAAELVDKDEKKEDQGADLENSSTEDLASQQALALRATMPVAPGV